MRPVVPLVGLALLASIVTGRERTAPPELTRIALAPNVRSTPATAQELELEKLVRQHKEPSFTDVFAVRSRPITVEPPPVVAVPVRSDVPAPAEPSVPAVRTAPPLPFAYLGRMVNGERTVAYVLKGEQMFLAEAGQTIGEDYRVEGVTGSAVQFVYIPLGTKQVLTFPVRE